MEELKQRIEIGAHNILKMSEEELSTAIAKDFGLDIRVEEKVIAGFQSQVYRASLDGKNVFVRINEKARKFEVEIEAYKILKELNIPSPDVLAYLPNPKSIGLPTIILSEAEGVVLGKAELSPEEEDGLYENMGKTLKVINGVKIDGFGPLQVVEGKLEGEFRTTEENNNAWSKNVTSSISYLSENNLISQEEVLKIQKIFNEVCSLAIDQTSLLYRDMHRGHVFVDGVNIKGIIDLERMYAGDPRYDIAMSLVFQDERRQEHFKKGYGALAYDPMVLKYLVIITVEKIKFRLKVAKNDSAADRLASLRDLLGKID